MSLHPPSRGMARVGHQDPPAGSGNLREGQVVGLDGGIPAKVLLP